MFSYICIFCAKLQGSYWLKLDETVCKMSQTLFVEISWSYNNFQQPQFIIIWSKLSMMQLILQKSNFKICIKNTPVNLQWTDCKHYLFTWRGKFSYENSLEAKTHHQCYSNFYDISLDIRPRIVGIEYFNYIHYVAKSPRN